MTTPTPNPAALLSTLAEYCAAQDVSAWVVGGTIRDIVMGRAAGDLDIAVNCDGVTLARQIADTLGCAFVALDMARGTGRIVCGSDTPHPLTIDMVQLRAPTIHDDLTLRDFTINALALPLSPAFPPTNHDCIIDPCGGLHDLADHCLRPCLPTSISDDPVRILRATRMAAELGFTMTPALQRDISDHAALIERVAMERVTDELLKLLAQRESVPWLRLLDEAGVLTRIVPELEPARQCEQPIVHFLPVLAHMLETVAALEWLLAGLDTPSPDTMAVLPVAVQTVPHLPRTLPYANHLRDHMADTQTYGHPRPALLKLAALLHDNAKPETKQPKPGGGVTFHDHQKIGAQVAHSVARRLRLSRNEATYLATVVRAHMRPGQLITDGVTTPRARARFFRDTQDAGPDVLLHALADHLSARGPMIDLPTWQAQLDWSQMMLAAYWERRDDQSRSLVNGHELITHFALEAGPLVGELLREIAEARAAGEIASREEALSLARRYLDERGTA